MLRNSEGEFDGNAAVGYTYLCRFCIAQVCLGVLMVPDGVNRLDGVGSANVIDRGLGLELVKLRLFVIITGPPGILTERHQCAGIGQVILSGVGCVLWVIRGDERMRFYICIRIF